MSSRTMERSRNAEGPGTVQVSSAPCRTPLMKSVAMIALAMEKRSVP
jgi:hypothetical protein